MRLTLCSWVGILGLSNLVVGKALDNVFEVKSGITEGGCDNYRTGQVNANLDAYFEEAQKVIKTASDAFGQYNTDVQIQKLAKSFFGITPNAQRSGTATTADEVLLKHVQGRPTEHIGILTRFCLNFVNDAYSAGWFQSLDNYAQGKSGKIPLYCNSDWLEQTTTGMLVDSQHIYVTRTTNVMG